MHTEPSQAVATMVQMLLIPPVPEENPSLPHPWYRADQFMLLQGHLASLVSLLVLVLTTHKMRRRPRQDSLRPSRLTRFTGAHRQQAHKRLHHQHTTHSMRPPLPLVTRRNPPVPRRPAADRLRATTGTTVTALTDTRILGIAAIAAVDEQHPTWIPPSQLSWIGKSDILHITL